MTHATVTSTTHPGAHPDIYKPVLSAVLLSAAMTAVLVIRDTNDGPAWRVSLVLAATVAIVSWVVFGAIVRRTFAKDRATSARRALILGVVTVFSVGAFWMALPPVFAVATFVLAANASAGHPNCLPRQAAIGAGLAAFGLIAALVLTIVG